MMRMDLSRRLAMTAGLAVAFLALGALAASGAAGWMRHGETLWIAMADGAWAGCF